MQNGKKSRECHQGMGVSNSYVACKFVRGKMLIKMIMRK